MTTVGRVLRGAGIAVGAVLIALGLVGALLPTHLLGLLMVPGLVLVLRNSFRARRGFVRMKRRHPRLLHPVRRLLRRRPEVRPVVWTEMLRAERRLPLRWRRLRAWRRRMRSRRAG